MHALIEDVYRQCKNGGTEAFAKQLYKPFTIEELNTKMVEMLRPDGVDTPIELVFQSIGGLHTACPNHPGDWYFTGDYPTPGGVRLCNQAFVNYIEKVYNQETNTVSRTIIRLREKRSG